MSPVPPSTLTDPVMSTLIVAMSALTPTVVIEMPPAGSVNVCPGASAWDVPSRAVPVPSLRIQVCSPRLLPREGAVLKLKEGATLTSTLGFIPTSKPIGERSSTV